MKTKEEFNIWIEVAGIKKLVKKLWIVEGRLPDSIDDWIKKVITYAHSEAIPETPIDKWILSNSYRTKFGRLFWSLFNIRKYWIFVHEGTRFIKWNPFLTRTAKKVEQRWPSIINSEINKLLRII